MCSLSIVMVRWTQGHEREVESVDVKSAIWISVVEVEGMCAGVIIAISTL